jgi:hypothetical protein
LGEKIKEEKKGKYISKRKKYTGKTEVAAK